MSDLQDLLNKLAAENLKKAEAFAAQFPGLKVTASSGQDGRAVAVHHNDKTGWGFTVMFLTTPDMKEHIHAYAEYVGAADDVAEVVMQLKKIVVD